MSLESYNGNLSDLVITNPTPTDPKSQGDDHLRGIKKTLVDTFGATTGPIYGPSGVRFPDGTAQGSAAYSKAESDGPAFRAMQYGAGQGAAPTVEVVILTDKEFDTANCVTIGADAKFQPNVSGYYSLSAAVEFNNPAAGSDCLIDIYKNNVEHARIAQSAGNGRVLQLSGSVVVYMNGTTDFCQLKALAPSGTIGGSPTSFTYFQGFLARRA